jgi:hypothetical protein
MESLRFAEPGLAECNVMIALLSSKDMACLPRCAFAQSASVHVGSVLLGDGAADREREQVNAPAGFLLVPA